MVIKEKREYIEEVIYIKVIGDKYLIVLLGSFYSF